MKLIIAPIIFSSFLLSSNVCAFVDSNVLKEEIQLIKDKYQSSFDEIRKQAKSIGDLDLSDTEAAIKIKIEPTMVEHQLKLHIPEIITKLQTWKLHIPEIHSKLQTWIFHTPSTRMELVDFGLFKTHIPVPFMQEHVVKLHIPEVYTKLQTWKLHIPEVYSKLQTWKFHIPSVNIKDVDVEIRKAKEKGNALGQKGRTLAVAMETEINNATERFLTKGKGQVAKKFDDAISSVQTMLSQQSDQEIKDKLSKNLADIKVEKANALTKIQDTIDNLRS